MQEACAKCFAVRLFEILQTTWNKKHQNAKSSDGKLKTKDVMFFVSYFSCDFERFQISIREQQSIWCKQGARFLYWVDFIYVIVKLGLFWVLFGSVRGSVWIPICIRAFGKNQSKVERKKILIRCIWTFKFLASTLEIAPYYAFNTKN